jgi:ATP-dependent DNA helicase RecQ
LKLTGSARGVLRGETEVWLREEQEGRRNRAMRARRGNLADASPGPTRGADRALLEALRAWRSETARKRGVPAYVVLHDSTLDGIAAVRPATLAGLRGIAGIGDKKLEHYGAELIALIATHRAGA